MKGKIAIFILSIALAVSIYFFFNKDEAFKLKIEASNKEIKYLESDLEKQDSIIVVLNNELKTEKRRKAILQQELKGFKTIRDEAINRVIDLDEQQLDYILSNHKHQRTE